MRCGYNGATNGRLAGGDGTGIWELFVGELYKAGDDPVWDEALDWVMLMRDHALDAQAEQRLLDWLGTSPQHVKCFRQALVVWQVTGQLSPELTAAIDPSRPAHGSDADAR